MKRVSNCLCFLLILCMLGSILPFALADSVAVEAAGEAVATDDAAPAEESAEETAVAEDTTAAEEAAEAPSEITPKGPAAWTVMI